MDYPPNDDNQSQFTPPPPNTSYPYQPPYLYQPLQAPLTPPPKKTNGCLIAIAVVVAIIVALAICGTISNSISQSTASSPDATATADANNAVANTNTQVQATDTPLPTDTPQPTAQPTFPPQQWTFTGNGIQKTAQFAPLIDTWQLSWTCDPASYGSEYNLIVSLYDINGNLIDVAVNVICKDGVTSGSTMEYNASGLYYLEINSEGPWTIKIQTQ